MQEMFKIDEQSAVLSNPGGRFHGWLFRRHPDGQWISVRKLDIADAPKWPIFDKPTEPPHDP